MNKPLRQTISWKDFAWQIGKYLILLIFLFLTGYYFIPFLNEIKLFSTTTYDFTNFYIAQFLLFFSLGLVVGFIDLFIPELNKSGTWRIKIIKLVVWGVPLGLIALTNVVIRFPLLGSLQLFHILTSMGFEELVIASQILFGYTVISSVYKTSGNSS